MLVVVVGCQESQKDDTKHIEEVATHETKRNGEIETYGTTNSEAGLINVVHCNGKAEVPPQFKLDIFSKSSGYLMAVNVLNGQFVKKGQVLCEVGGKEIIEIQEAYLLANLESKRLSQLFDRNQSLLESNGVSAKEHEQVTIALEQSRVKENALKASMEFGSIPLPKSEKDVLSQIAIKSQIDGYVSSLSANLGMKVDTDTKLMQIVNTRHYHFELEVFPTDADKIEVGQKVKIKPAGTDEFIDGYVYLIDKAANIDRQTIAVHVHPNKVDENVKVNSFVEAIILINEYVSSTQFSID